MDGLRGDRQVFPKPVKLARGDFVMVDQMILRDFSGGEQPPEGGVADHDFSFFGKEASKPEL